ncbi:unnamed protein product [Larinioides sclopetarius]|uniref:C2H2-type domain-containing protein n=1 Tax=Larinioides sclopetarius TaxID=280406 RepID=A0AAV2B3J1_9ARAC
MADAPFFQPRSAGPEYYAPEADVSTRMTDEDSILLKPTPYARTQTKDDFDFLSQIQPGGNILDTSKTVFSEFHEYSNAVETEVEDVLSPMGAWTDFDMASGSRNHAESSEFYMQPPFPENVLKYSHQSTQHENNKIVSIQGKHTVDYPTVHMECRTINKDVCGINEAARSKNVDNYHPQGPEPRNVAVESCMPLAFLENSRQSIQYESNKNIFIQGTHTVDFSAVPHQSNHSYRQYTEENGSRNASAQRKQLIKSLVLTSSKKYFVCEKCEMMFTEESALNTHVLNNCYKCGDCGMASSSQKVLRDHSRIHKEKSFECSMCDYATYNKNNLKRHFNRIHMK